MYALIYNTKKIGVLYDSSDSSIYLSVNVGKYKMLKPFKHIYLKLNDTQCTKDSISIFLNSLQNELNQMAKSTKSINQNLLMNIESLIDDLKTLYLQPETKT